MAIHYNAIMSLLYRSQTIKSNELPKVLSETEYLTASYNNQTFRSMFHELMPIEDKNANICKVIDLKCKDLYLKKLYVIPSLILKICQTMVCHLH